MDIEKTMEFLLEQQARFDQRMDQLTSNQIDSEARHEREMLDIRTQLKRAVQMGVEEARRERQRRLEMHNELKNSIVEVSGDLKSSIVALSAAQQVTEEKLQRLIDSLQPRQ